LQRSADDPAAMVVANSVRYYRAGVSRAQSNAEEAVTMLQTAEGAMDQITQMVQRIRNLTISALSSGTTDSSQMAALQADLDAGVRSITTIATSTSYGGLSLLDGSLADNSLSDNAKVYYQSLIGDATKLPGGIMAGTTLSIGAPSSPLARSYQIESYGAGIPATTTVGGSPPAPGWTGTISLTGPKGTMNIPATETTTIDDVVKTINASSSVVGLIAAYDPATGDLQVESTSYGNSTFSLASDFGMFAGGSVSASGSDIILEYTDAAGALQQVTLSQDPTSPGGLTYTNANGGIPEGSLPPYTHFAPGAFSLTVRDPNTGGINQVIQPAPTGLTATRSSSTAVQIGALASQRVTIDIADMRAGALGHSAGLAGSGVGFASLEDLVTNQALLSGNATEALTVIDAALAEVLQIRGAAGALQGNTIERVMESLGTSVVNLQEYEGLLRDADMAAESAEFARVQVMLQAATAMLAQANQVPQMVLQLLK
jgi:flagellin